MGMVGDGTGEHSLDSSGILNLLRPEQQWLRKIPGSNALLQHLREAANLEVRERRRQDTPQLEGNIAYLEQDLAATLMEKLEQELQ